VIPNTLRWLEYEDCDAVHVATNARQLRRRHLSAPAARAITVLEHLQPPTPAARHPADPIGPGTASGGVAWSWSIPLPVTSGSGAGDTCIRGTVRP
jgi:hypothetical protein